MKKRRMTKPSIPRVKGRKSAAIGHQKAGNAAEAKYLLRLYITGSTPRAKAAIIKVRNFCEEHLKGHYQLEIIDIYQQPTFAKDEQIIAAPTLIKKLPEPLRKLVGDFSQPERVLLGLDLRKHAEHSNA